jgi:2TM family of unknown function (DUF5676)
MSLNTRAFGLAGGLTAAVLFVLCAAAVAVAPNATTAFAGYLIHTDVSALSRTLTWGNFFGGLVAWTVGTAMTFALAAWFYNRLLTRTVPLRVERTATVAAPEVQHA